LSPSLDPAAAAAAAAALAALAASAAGCFFGNVADAGLAGNFSDR